MSGQQSGGDPVDAAGERASDCCSASHSLSDGEVAADVETLAALGNHTRYEALRLIVEAGDEGICVCDLEPTLGVSQGAVSQALSRLFSAGLVERRKEGRWRYYTATDCAERLARVLDETRELDDDA
jgi:ArsR family transcriptional regulator